MATKNTSFRVILSNPTGGATLGRASTTGIILDASGLTSRTVAPPFDTALTIRREAGVTLITWSGGGQLQRADRPTGPWQMLTNASSRYAVQSALPTTFYRVTRPRPVNLYIPSDLDLDLPGLDTVITRYMNSPPGSAVELWTIIGGGHGANVYDGSSSSEFAPRVIDWLLAHPKP